MDDDEPLRTPRRRGVATTIAGIAVLALVFMMIAPAFAA